MPPTVLLSASSTSQVDDLRELLTAAGFAIQSHVLGSAPGVDFGAIAVALIEVGDQTDTATAQTRRWRAELGDEHLPIVWVHPASDAAGTARGLDAGADAVLSRPLDGSVFQAQLRTALRTRTAAARVASRAAEARILGDQLNRTFAQIDRELDLTRQVRLALLQRSLPETGSARFAVCHHPRGRNGGDFYAVHTLESNRVVFLIGDVIGPSTAGGLLGKFIAEAVFDAARLNPAAPAGKLLAEANLALLRLKLEDSPLVALLVGVLNPEMGNLTLARAGLPAPMLIPTNGHPESWAVPGPFLGIAETTYLSHSATLKAGDKLLIGTDGTRPDGTPGHSDDTRLLEAATRHRALAGQRFIDAVASELLVEVQHDDDVTLLCVEISE